MPAKPLSKSELRSGLTAREPDDHKGVFGHVLVVAGSRGMPGAAILAARGALRSGAGLVTVAAPASAAPVIAGAVPSAMTLALPESPSGAFRPEGVDRLKEYSKDRRVSTMAIGPGVTTHADAAKFVLLALSGVAAGAVVDADALNILAAQDKEGVRQMLKARKLPCVYTPHPGEAARLLGVRTGEIAGARQQSVEKLAKALGGVVLLKGKGSLISSGSRTVLNPTGGPALGKAGSGDVLAGLVAGLWAQSVASGRVKGDAPFLSAALGAWLHGAAGDAAGKDKTPWAASSSDLPEYLPAAFKALCA